MGTDPDTEQEFQQLLEVFRYLASPYDERSPQKSNSITSPSDVFQSVTDYCLARIDYLESSKPLINRSNNNSTTSPTSSWKLACLILSSLSKLKVITEQLEENQPEEEKSIDVLSLQNQITIQKSVELAIGFGIGPYLLPGLGVPPKLRKMNPCVSRFISDAQSVSPYNQFLRLAHTLEILLECSKQPTLNTLIAQKYCSDLLAGLLQVCRSPILPPKPVQPGEEASGALTLEEYSDVMQVRSRLTKVMTQFLRNIPKPILVNSLFLVGAAEKPRWIKASCNSLLFDLILSRNGLLMISSTLIDVSGGCDTWKLMRIIATLMKDAVTKSPHEMQSANLRNLAEQSTEMIMQWESNGEKCNIDKDSVFVKLPYGVNLELVQIGLFCGINLMDIDFTLGKAAFWDNLFSPVLKLSSIGTKDNDEIRGNVCLIARSVVYAEMLLGLLKPMSAALPLKRLQPLWSLFLQIFVACDSYLNKPVQEPKAAWAAEQLQNKLKDVLVLLWEIYGCGAGEKLSIGETSSGETQINLCEFMMALVLNYDERDAPTLNRFDFNCSDDNVSIVKTRQELVGMDCDYSEVFESYLNRVCTCLGRDVLKRERLKGLWGKLFKQLLAWGSEKHPERKWRSDELPTRLAGNEVKVSVLDCQRFITFKLIGELGDEEKILEQFGTSESMEETLAFLELLLRKFASEVTTYTGANHGFDSSQLIMYALGIIGALIEAALASAVQLSKEFPGNTGTSDVNKEIGEFWNSMEVFIPHLRKLSECTQPSLSRQGIPQMADDLLLRIGTRGESHKTKSEFSIKTRFQQASEDVANPMVHVKGHGLLELRKLVLEKDREALENQLNLVNIFRENLRHEDSYIYLMAIQGMAALAHKFHHTVVPILIEEYDKLSSNDADTFTRRSQESIQGNMDNDERIEMKMKVGEILVKVIQNLNALAPIYRVPLTNVLFRLMRDEEPLIRVSALANLGEMCHFLKFSLGVILTEVWFCVESILSTENDIHVRRAALHLIVLLLKGVQNDLTAQDILEDGMISEYLRDARRLLTRLEQSEPDLVAKTHCQLALQELQLIVKKLFTPNNSLAYKIQVLNL